MRAVFLTIAALAAGCVTTTGNENQATSTPTPQCTPPPAHQFTITVAGANAASHDGDFANLRVYDTAVGVLSCSSALVASGSFALTSSAFGPLTPHVELVLNSGAETTFGSGDQHYAFTLGVDGTTTGTACDVNIGWTIDFDASASKNAITWPLGTSCN